jgi:hypothetical protein
MTALLLVSGDRNNHNLPQSGRLFILRVMGIFRQFDQSACAPSSANTRIFKRVEVTWTTHPTEAMLMFIDRELGASVVCAIWGRGREEGADVEGRSRCPDLIVYCFYRPDSVCVW